MVLPVTSANSVKVYTVSGGLGSRSIPDWIVRKRKKALKKDEEYRTRVELLQDFEFPEASNRIKTTRDGNYVMATGTYKPQMRVYEYAEMSMKFERHTDAENINFEILSDDWTKTVHLQNDRWIEFHTQGGVHYKTRIPKYGRDLAYHFPSCDLLITASTQEVYRLNLEQGRFSTSIQTDATEGVNVVEINPAHQLFGFGTSNGTVELWDPRSRARVGLLSDMRVPTPLGQTDSLQVTALKFREDGLTMAAGTSTGHTLLYDLRSSVPFLVKDHQYGLPIKSINFHEGEAPRVIVADNKVVKIWDRNNGKHFTSIEPETDINDVCLVENSGLIFTAQEGIQMGAYYIPQLGPAPRWASFLDNITEEMEENPNRDVYDEYKFVTRKELSLLGLDHLMGTNVLKAYMHGFFVDFRLYEKAKLIANPFAYDEYKAKTVREKIEKERGSRIRVNNKMPAVNKDVAKKLMSGKNKKAGGEELLQDDRFKGMFEDPEFQVDTESKEYLLLHPTHNQKRQAASSDDEEEEEESVEQDDSDDSDRISGSDSEDDLVSQIRKERGLHVRSTKTAQTKIRTGAYDTSNKQKNNDKSSNNKKQKRSLEMRMGSEGGRMSSRKEVKMWKQVHVVPVEALSASVLVAHEPDTPTDHRLVIFPVHQDTSSLTMNRQVNESVPNAGLSNTIHERGTLGKLTLAIVSPDATILYYHIHQGLVPPSA
ncbi:WD40-repeat-containing domain protein [Dichotomocladium elegans]|nr:WD40-repeat-containing domain protein [Dichotomocladium elegans]